MNEITCSCTYTDGDNMFCPVHGTLERSKTSVAQPMQNSQTSSSPMTPIQQEAERRIIEEAEKVWPDKGANSYGTKLALKSCRGQYVKAATFGYSLAQQEIERLKGFIRDHHNKTLLANCPGITKEELEEGWQYYKQQHNL